MDGEIETTLAAAAEAMREYELVARRRDELRARAEELSAQLASLRLQHEAEQQDVERLEGVSMARVWAAVRGSREDDLARERAEADAARYRVADAQARLATVQREQADEVRGLLSSAANWSTYDTFLGGGMIGSAIKHSRLDEAAQAAARADACLLTLRTELADVAGIEATAPRLTTDGLTRFVDIWFDNIFTDLAVRERISQAQQSVEQSSYIVAQLNRRLAEREATDRDRLEAIETERRALLTQA